MTRTKKLSMKAGVLVVTLPVVGALLHGAAEASTSAVAAGYPWQCNNGCAG